MRASRSTPAGGASEDEQASNERLHVAQKIMTHGTTHRVFGKRAMTLGGKRSVEVIGQLIFKFVTKHL
jgi:hypothetical protein